jgi:hypothetical protein
MSAAMHTATDPFGHPITLQHADSVAAVHGFVHGFLGYTPSILQVLPAADVDHSLVVQTWAAVLWMFSESPAGPPKARAHLARARAANLPATDRERRVAEAVARWVDGDLGGAITLHTAWRTTIRGIWPPSSWASTTPSTWATRPRC